MSSLLCLTWCDSLLSTHLIVLILSPLPLSVVPLLFLFSPLPLSSYILFSQEDKTNCVIFIPPSHLSPARVSPLAFSICIHPLSPRSMPLFLLRSIHPPPPCLSHHLLSVSPSLCPSKSLYSCCSSTRPSFLPFLSSGVFFLFLFLSCGT